MAVVVEENSDGSISRSSESEIRDKTILGPVSLNAILGGSSSYETFETLDGNIYYWAESEGSLPNRVKEKL